MGTKWVHHADVMARAETKVRFKTKGDLKRAQKWATLQDMSFNKFVLVAIARYVEQLENANLEAAQTYALSSKAAD